MTILPTLPVSITLLSAIVAAAALVYLPFLVVAYGRVKVGYDMAAPRSLFDKLPAYAQRATWAHQNAFETFLLFAVAALMAVVTGVEESIAAGAGLAFVVARLFYPVFYILNVPLGRSLMFAIGSASTATLFVLSLLHAYQTTPP
ncbi:MAG: MAPEG family protein [Leptolyngbyaceae cyanobacterium SL_7_1]|nr:MAPEG family protein [Leptolyngbyaceae cyanobacterium SL_7_1]